jgi:hypothetical protein
MLVRATIMRNPAGQVVTEVIDRGDHLPETVYRVTDALGRQLSEGRATCVEGETTNGSADDRPG